MRKNKTTEKTAVDYMLTIQPTYVESERAFLTAGQFCTKN